MNAVDTLEIVELDVAEAEAALSELADVLVDAVESGSSVNFMRGFGRAEGEGFWRGQLPGIADKSRILIVAREAGRVVGTIIVSFAHQPNSPHRAELGKMLVHSSTRRRGLGKRLLTTAEAIAKRHGRTLLHLDTATGSAGEHLYRSAGWIELGTMPDHSMTPDGVLAPATFFYKFL
ncbi:GNAT family N-acetyltransferase [Flaviflagellibacter deserti]|uniref:GNAT family N-acetyltransferase n=1 Tax=Flaviflagellibacter deserti TaxID=2267266 RepID=A0ABV9Z0T9_9HYPH